MTPDAQKLEYFIAPASKVVTVQHTGIAVSSQCLPHIVRINSRWKTALKTLFF
tara:strand:+ start:4202 stop:4360 length:159 start_codon:yes stop_codon:yes gene_type:complete